jgi:hypothetical protein
LFGLVLGVLIDRRRRRPVLFATQLGCAVLLALIAVGFWWYVARGNRSDTLREAGWIFAVSQLLVLCVPVALAIVKAIAIGVIALLAIAALIFLFTERPK